MTEALAVEVEEPPTPRLPVALAVVLLAATLLIGLLATFDIGHDAERSFIKAIAFRERVTSDALIGTFQWISWLGDAAQRSLVMVLFAGWLFWRKQRWSALAMVIAPPLAGATSSLLKEIFSRARPEIVPQLDVVTNLSFPSGHATNVMATALLAALLIPQTRRPFWVLIALSAAAIVGMSRILLGVHWPSDVLGGWCWGAGFALLGVHLARTGDADQKAKRSPILTSRPPSGA